MRAFTQNGLVRRSIGGRSIGLAVMVAALLVSTGQAGISADSGTGPSGPADNAPASDVVVHPRLWDPDSPVDILVHNPNHEQLALPAPYTVPTISDVYGPGVTQAEMLSPDRQWGRLEPLIVNVGSNISIAVTYGDGANEGFNDPTLGAARRAAFAAGAAVWAGQLQGPATIAVLATMSPRGGSACCAVLASSGPSNFTRDFLHAPLSLTYYPVALVQIISGSDPDPAGYDLGVDFNSDVDNQTVLGSEDWYYGLDGNPGTDIDFRTVTIHELCHGLGFVSSFLSNGTRAYDYPVVYDQYLANSSGTMLVSLPASPSNVTGNNVFWRGVWGNIAYFGDFGGTAPYVPLYAPSPWENGSSIAHLNEASFTGAWDLETPYYDDPHQTPDTIVLGIMQDIGHSRTNSRYVMAGYTGYEDGSSANPYNTLLEGVQAVPSGGFVRIMPGAYPGPITISRPMELHSGNAVIGSSH